MSTDSEAQDRLFDTGVARVLYVDDTEFRPHVTEVLEAEHERLAVTSATTVTAALDALSDGLFDAVISEYAVDDTDGLEFLSAVRDHRPEMPFLLYTGRGSEQIASDAISAGVTDYLRKEGTVERQRLLAKKVTDAVDHARTANVQQHLIRAVENAHEGVSILDEDGNLTYVNDAYASLYGYEPEEMLGCHWEMLYPEKGLEQAHEEILPAIDEEGSWHGESLGIQADGTTFLESHTVVGTAEGGFVCTVQDKTDRKQRQQELELKSDVMDAAPSGITIADASEPDNPIIYTNDRFTELTGYEESTIFGRNCRFLQGPETRDEPVAAIREAIDNAEPVTVELRNYRADGTMFWNEMRIRPIETDDEVTHYVGFQQDITDRKEREHTLKTQNERLEELANVLGHDLRNPAQVADLRIETLRDRHPESLEELDAIQRAIDRIHQLTEKLVAIARTDRNGMEIEPISLDDCAWRAWSYTATEAAQLRYEGGDEHVEADGDRLAELFENLFHNSIVHGRDDVTLRVGTLDDGFYVEDDGPGIPAGKHDDIFEMGYSERPHGNGLGLGIVAEIADAHGWEVSVTDGRDGGARFEFSGVDFVGRTSVLL